MSNYTSTIHGVFIERINQIINSKGSVFKMLNKNSTGYLKFGECYFSEVFSGSVKGWKIHSKQTQNLTVPIGELKIVLIDLRKTSGTYMKILEILIGKPDNFYRLTIPPGIAYGFECISHRTALIVNCTDTEYDIQENKTIPLNDSSIPYSWKV